MLFYYKKIIILDDKIIILGAYIEMIMTLIYNYKRLRWQKKLRNKYI